MGEAEDTQGLRGPAEYALTVVATVAFAAAFVFGPAAIAAWSLARDGASPYGLGWAVVAAAWLTILVVAAVRDQETRGWLVFALAGWLVLPLAALHRRWQRRG